MSHTILSWESADGLPLFGQSWQPSGTARAVICLVHGLGEHSTRYTHVAAALNAAGYAVLAFDLRGHGRSGGQRGHSPSFDALIRDIDRLLEQAALRFPGLPQVLYGHSLGGLLTLNYVLRRHPDLLGVIVTGPALQARFPLPAWKLLLGRIMRRVAPTFSMDTGLPATELCKCDEGATCQDYLQDPLVHCKASARMGLDTIDMGRWTLQHACEWPQTPLLLMHGELDGLTRVEAGARFAAEGGKSIELVIWPGLGHEIHNEPQQEQVFAHIIAWLDART